MKTGQGIFIAVLFLVIGIVAANWFIKRNSVCYYLPTEGGTDVWGPKYWAAIHDIANRIPCSLCRNEGQELFIFVHDAVNLKLKKELKDQKNFDKWLDKFSEIKQNGTWE